MADYTGDNDPNIFTGTDDPETIRGEGGNDVLDGAGGDDKIYGGAGRDEVHGGGGDDKFHVTDFNDFVAGEIYDGGDGFDTLYLSNFTFYDLSIATITSIEGLSMATDNASVQMSLAQADAFTSFTGVNTQFFLTTGGSMSLAGVNIVGSAGFKLADADTVFDARGVTGLGTNGIGIQGGAGNDTIIGGLHDYLLGGGGNDTIIGGRIVDGGAGADKMYGTELGSNYTVDRQDDLIFDSFDNDDDVVFSTANFYLYEHVEHLYLQGGNDLFGVGNSVRNIIDGNSGNNTLIGGGGDDTLYGRIGNDLLFGQTGNDILAGNEGNDYLAGGDGDDNLHGDEGGDALYGEAGNDQLYGGDDFVYDMLVGGDGADDLHGNSGLGDYDALYGNAGDDSFFVDTGDDLTFEQAGEGFDTVYADVAGTNNGVYLYANIEQLVLRGTTAFGVGNELDNFISGNAVANTLLGGAGNDVISGFGGNDILFGQAGADRFQFEHGTGMDNVGDFVPGTDKIDLVQIGYNWQQVVNSLHENGGNTAIDLGNGDVVILIGVTAAQLHQSDFVLSTVGSVSEPLAAAAQGIAAPYATAVNQDGNVDAPLWTLVDPVTASGLWA